MNAPVQYLSRKEIDIALWDKRIETAANGLIYAHSFYLDGVCDHWDAVVCNNYESVMPLPWKLKWGVRYLYAPPFMQQLGLIDNTAGVDLQEAIRVVKNKFKYGDILFNFTNVLPGSLEKTNFILDLDRPYSEIEKNYSGDLKKNLKAVKKDSLLFSFAPNIEEVIGAFKKEYESRMGIADNDYKRFCTLCLQLEKKGMAFGRKVENDKRETVAVALFLKDGKRIYNIMNTTTAAGRGAKANHYLLTEVIKEFAGQPLLFDFEGSDLPGVKEFYFNFRPAYQPFFHYHFNRLPWPLRFLKK